MFDPVQLILNSYKIKTKPFFQFKKGKINLHLKKNHILSEVFDRICSQTNIHAFSHQKTKGFFCLFIRDFFRHL